VYTTLRRAAAASFLVASIAGADDERPFAVRDIPSSGRTVAAELVDLDGDGRQDLLQFVIFELPPDERRVLQVHLQRPDGEIPAATDFEGPLPEGSVAYDFADLDGEPGVELILLRPDGLEILSFARPADGPLGPRSRRLAVPGGRTLGVALDERGFDRVAIANDDFGDGPWLVVPGLAETFLFGPGGALRGRIDSGARANYFIQPPGPTFGESDIQLFLDAPRISVGDVNGDGRPDIVASGRHQLRVFERRADGSFPQDPDRTIALRRVTYEDHIRGSGSVRAVARDVDGDGLLDLLLSLTTGGVMDARADSSLYMNRDGRWNLDRPDAVFESPRTLSADQLVDLDGDARLELVRVGIPMGIFDLVEIFVQRALDVHVAVYPLPGTGATAAPAGAKAPPKPAFELELGLPLDLETSRPAGFLPSVGHDVNGDGYLDHLSGADGKRLDVRLGDGTSGFGPAIRQEMVTEGQLRAGDVDGDGLTDFVLCNARRKGAPVRLMINRGILPGTPPSPRIGPPAGSAPAAEPESDEGEAEQ